MDGINNENELELDLDAIMAEFGTPSEETAAPAEVPEPTETEASASGDSEVSDSASVEAKQPTVQMQGSVERVTGAQAPAGKKEGTEASTVVLPDIPKAALQSDDDTITFTPPELPEQKKSNLDAKTHVMELDGIQAEEAEEKAKTARSKLQLLKSKLIAGPEKRYYDLSEIGVGRLQAAILIQMAITGICFAVAVLLDMKLVPDNRLRLVIFSQVLAMLVSALIGSELIMDAVGDLFRGKFGINFLLVVTLLACAADAVVCLFTLKVPCCGAFALEMTFALLGRLYSRITEMSQMDTLRKATRLVGLSKKPDYLGKNPAVLRTEGDLDDFWDTYRKSSTPEKIQNIFGFVALIVSLMIAAMGAVLYGPSMAFQALSVCLMVSVPAAAFISQTRPAMLLEKRLHMVGTVLCGWQGVKRLKGKAYFPVTDEDIFPSNTTKVNGVKFYGVRKSEDVISYTGSVLIEAESGLAPVFMKLMENRRCNEQAVLNFQDFGNGYAGEVRGEPVYVGDHDFLVSMGVDVPTGTAVAQGVYAAISGKLVAVYAMSYAKMRSSAAGLVSLGGARKIIPVMLTRDFMVTPAFLAEKFGVRTNRIFFPPVEVKHQLLQVQADPMAPVGALTTRTDLVSYVYAVSGASALAGTCTMGLVLSLLCGILGLLIMCALVYLGASDLLTPLRLMLYELIWLIPTWLITEWTKTV